MTKQKPKVPSAVISWFFLLYFVILFAERLQSLIRATAANQLFMDAFEGVASMIVALQIECKKIANKIQKTLMSLPTSVFQFVHIYSFTLHKNQPNVKVIR